MIIIIIIVSQQLISFILLEFYFKVKCMFNNKFLAVYGKKLSLVFYKATCTS